jgi:serine/threonine protein kinase
MNAYPMKWNFIQRPKMIFFTILNTDFKTDNTFISSCISSIYLISQGGDLGHILLVQDHFEINQVRLYAAELVLAIEALHSKNIIYRNLRLEHVLLDKDGHIVLTDLSAACEGVG